MTVSYSFRAIVTALGIVSAASLTSGCYQGIYFKDLPFCATVTRDGAPVSGSAHFEIVVTNRDKTISLRADGLLAPATGTFCTTLTANVDGLGSFSGRAPVRVQTVLVRVDSGEVAAAYDYGLRAGRKGGFAPSMIPIAGENGGSFAKFDLARPRGESMVLDIPVRLPVTIEEFAALGAKLRPFVDEYLTGKVTENQIKIIRGAILELNEEFNQARASRTKAE